MALLAGDQFIRIEGASRFTPPGRRLLAGEQCSRIVGANRFAKNVVAA